MNTIQTLGDLKKALSIYPDELPVVFRSSEMCFSLNHDTQIAFVREPIVNGSAMYTEILLIPQLRTPTFVRFHDEI